MQWLGKLGQDRSQRHPAKILVRLLVLASLASFLLDVRPSLSESVFIASAVGLALAAGLGSTDILDPWLTLAAVSISILRDMYARPGGATIYAALLGGLVLTFLFGKLVKQSAYAIPVALMLAVVALSLCTSTAIQHP